MTASRLDATALNRLDRMDRRVRIGLRLVRSASPAETAVLLAVGTAASAVALPYGTTTGLFVIAAGLLLLAAAVRSHHRDLDGRRRALAAAGARRRDTAVITALGPVGVILAAAVAGAIVALCIGKAPSAGDVFLPFAAAAVAVSFL